MTVEFLRSLVPNESKSLHIELLLCKKFIHQGHYISLQILPNRSVWGDLESIFGVEMTFLCTPKSCNFGSEEKKIIQMNGYLPGRKYLQVQLQIFASWVANVCVQNRKHRNHHHKHLNINA